MKTNPNDAAFTQVIGMNGNPTLGQGLTKREYFAIMIMQGLLSAGYTGDVSEISVNRANAIISELNRRTSGELK